MKNKSDSCKKIEKHFYSFVDVLVSELFADKNSKVKFLCKIHICHKSILEQQKCRWFLLIIILLIFLFLSCTRHGRNGIAGSWTPPTAGMHFHNNNNYYYFLSVCAFSRHGKSWIAGSRTLLTRPRTTWSSCTPWRNSATLSTTVIL